MSESRRLTQLVTKTAEGKCFNKKYFIIKENITVNSVSIIIPVKDNLNGLLKLIDSIEENLANKEEIIDTPRSKEQGFLRDFRS